MRRNLVILCAGAIAFAGLAGTAMATAVPDAATKLCADKLQNETLLYVNAVQKQIRLSIKNNTNGKDSKCGGGFGANFACAGGVNHGDACTDNTPCTGGQCAVNTTKGIGGAINKAKGKLRGKIIDFCTDPQLLALFGTGTARCPDPDSPAVQLDTGELADCLLGGATGDILGAQFGSTEGDVLGRAAHNVVPDPTEPIGVCGVTLGSVLQIGSASSDATVGEAGNAAPLNIEAGSCAAQPCDTNSQGVIGNNLTAPTQTFAGLIPICLVTVTGDAGNGTPQDGVIHISGASVGNQTSFAPILSTVLIGTTCPKCDSVNNVCDSGDNAGLPCSAEGGTDTACPPTIVGSPPVIPNPLDLDTEPNSIAVPPNSPGTGSTNPAGAFCGSCDLDPTQGCDNDADCVATSTCGAGFGLGCCVFGSNTGAFGVSTATTASANGVRGPYMPQLATIFCTGESGSALVDATQGLPGPVRLIQEQLNAFEY